MGTDVDKDTKAFRTTFERRVTDTTVNKHLQQPAFAIASSTSKRLYGQRYRRKQRIKQEYQPSTSLENFVT